MICTELQDVRATTELNVLVGMFLIYLIRNFPFAGGLSLDEILEELNEALSGLDLRIKKGRDPFDYEFCYSMVCQTIREQITGKSGS